MPHNRLERVLDSARVDSRHLQNGAQDWPCDALTHHQRIFVGMFQLARVHRRFNGAARSKTLLQIVGYFKLAVGMDHLYLMFERERALHSAELAWAVLL